MTAIRDVGINIIIVASRLVNGTDDARVLTEQKTTTGDGDIDTLDTKTTSVSGTGEGVGVLLIVTVIMTSTTNENIDMGTPMHVGGQGRDMVMMSRRMMAPDREGGGGHLRRGLSSTSTSSDPLSSLIGPLPRSKDDTSNSITRRGRGFTRHQRHPPTSNIDAHFSTGYDPTQDVDVGGPYESPTEDPDPNQQTNDWDNALEALRDRRAWQAKQADRMREAGFDDDEIERWKASASTRTRTGDADLDLDIRHVKWRKKGEGREWDAGKVQDQD
ncbi:hypothetical protein KCU88_g4405, partial [Aureobasidium melanogenum]